MGARELREGIAGTATVVPPDFIVRLTTEQLFDAIAVQIDGPRAGDRRITLQWRFTDTGDEHNMTLRHGVLSHRRSVSPGAADATVAVARSALDELLARTATIDDLVSSGRLTIEGDQNAVGELLGLIDPPDPNFAIVTP